MSNIAMIIEKHFPCFKEIDGGSILIDEKIREMCKQNVCGHYDRNWTCPPAVSSLDVIRQKLAEFKSSVIIYRVYDIKSSFDLQGMIDGISDFRGRLIKMKNEFYDILKFLLIIVHIILTKSLFLKRIPLWIKIYSSVIF